MRLARIISYLFHPLLMPFLGLIIIFNSGIYIADIPFEFKRFVYALVFLCTIILPLTLFSSLYIFKLTQKLLLDERQQRIVPLILTAICYYLGYFLMSKYSPIELINVYLFSSVLVTLGVLLISLFWKISIHMAGIGGIIAIVLIISVGYTADLSTFFSIAILIAGLIASSRLALQVQSFTQVISGMLLGFFIVAGTLFQYLR